MHISVDILKAIELWPLNGSVKWYVNYISSTVAWRTPWTEEPGGLYIVHGVAKSRTRLSDFTFKALLERDRLKIKMVKHTCTVLGIWTDSARSSMKSVSDHPNAGTDYKKKKKKNISKLRACPAEKVRMEQYIQSPGLWTVLACWHVLRHWDADRELGHGEVAGE